MSVEANIRPADEAALVERQHQLRDYLVTYGQARAAGISVTESLHMATVTRHGMALVRAHDAARLDLGA